MVIMGDGMRPFGKLTDMPPYPTIARALHFYPDSLRVTSDGMTNIFSEHALI